MPSDALPPPVPGGSTQAAAAKQDPPVAERTAATTDPVITARKGIDKADRLEAEGDLRGAFLVCQTVLMDTAEELPSALLARIYLAMGRISRNQGKGERARKYLEKAAALDPVGARAEARAVEGQAEPEPAEATAPVEQTAPGPDGVAQPDLDDSAIDNAGRGPFEGRLIWTASFWLRAVALLVDLVFVSGLLSVMAFFAALVLGLDGDGVVQAMAGGLTNLLVITGLFFAVLLIYLTIFARFGGQTLGKMLFGLRVVRLDGRSLASLQALQRAIGMLLAGLPGFGGFIWAAFDLNRRGWHDRVGGTLVIQLRPPRSAMAPPVAASAE